MGHVQRLSTRIYIVSGRVFDGDLMGETDIDLQADSLTGGRSGTWGSSMG